MIIKVLNELRRMDEHSEKSNEEESNRAEYKNWKNNNNKTLEGINSRLDDTLEWICELEDRVVNITQAEQKKEKRILKNEDGVRDL